MKTEIASQAWNSRVLRGVGAILGLSILGALFSAPASAACMDPSAATGQGNLHQSLQSSLQAATGAQESGGNAQGIVGTWLVSYASEGSVYAEAFIQWHNDGTEWENINFPILGGNICLGSWKTVAWDKVSRFHVGWLYQNGTLVGHFTETETDVLSRDGNSYTGNNDTKFYTIEGVMFKEVIGTAAAKRIVP
jgi:hypothetical protein